MGEGFVGAEYVHRVSRAGDAQLHSHVVIANMTRADGRWTTLDGKALYAHLKTASALYHAELRAELTRRLGVEWEPVAPGKLAAEIRGVPRAVLRDQSRRRQEILRRMEERGESSPRAAQAAALDTRKAKDYDVDRRDVALELRTRIAAKGLGPAELADVVDRRRLERPGKDELVRLSRELLGPAGMTEHRSTFSRRDAIEQWASVAPPGRIGRPDPGGSPTAGWPSGRSWRWNPTQGLPAAWATSCRWRCPTAATSCGTRPGRCWPPNRPCSRRWPSVVMRGWPSFRARRSSGRSPRTRSLTAEQVALVWELTSSGHGIENVEAGAGAGKTYALRVAVDAFVAAGHPVLGTSTSNLATRTLEQEAGVRALNTTRLLAALDHGEALAPGTVLLVDEAGMVGTRKYQRLAEHVTAAGGKLIGVGDSRQLAEIEAGGAFRAISERFGAVELPGNRRQVDPEEIRALARLREGDVDAYVLFEAQRGRITVADDPAGAMRAQLADWWQATERHPQQESVLVALHRSSVAELNANAHALMRDAGRLGDDEITVDDRSFAAGDRVVLLRNNKTLDVDNGDRGVIVAVDADRRALTVELDAGREVRLPDWYLDAGWVDHGYALTAHKLQSTTVDRTFALASDGLYQEAGYSIATRARHETHFYLASQPDLADHEQAHGPPQPPEDAIARFARHLNDSRAQTLASDEPAHARARALTTTELREEHDRVAQALDDFPARQARALEVLADDAERQRTAPRRDRTADRADQPPARHPRLLQAPRQRRRRPPPPARTPPIRTRLRRRALLPHRSRNRATSAPTTTPSPGSTATPTTSATSARSNKSSSRATAGPSASSSPPPKSTHPTTSPPSSAPAPKTTPPAPRGNAASPPSRPTATATTSPQTTSSAPSDPRRLARDPTPSSETPNAPSAKPRTELGLGDDTLRPERAAIPDRLSEPPPRERGLSRDHGLSIDL